MLIGENIMNKYFFGLIGALMSTSVMAADLYVSGSVGTHVTGRGDNIIDVAVGAELNKNMRVEAAYQYDVDNKKNNLFAHVIPQYTIPNTGLTPYVLVGVGVDVESLDTNPMYVLGGGLRVELTKTVDFDLRYRRIDNTENTDKREVVTGGVSVKF
jgi:opacity protein-like surface antigen